MRMETRESVWGGAFSDSFSREMRPKCANSRFVSHFRPETYQKKADLERFDTFVAHSGRKCIGSGPCVFADCAGGNREEVP